MVSKSSIGSRPDAPDTSTRCISTFVRSRCFRNRSPSPLPSCAPSISPGTSATTKLRLPLSETTPRFGDQGGERVVGDLRPRGGDARDQRRFARVGKSDEPDIGEQLQVQLQLLGFAGVPSSKRRGARLVELTKRAFPRPPMPPCATQHALAGLDEVADEHRFVGRIRRLFVDQRADRHLELEIGGVRARAVGPLRRVRRAWRGTRD